MTARTRLAFALAPMFPSLLLLMILRLSEPRTVVLMLVFSLTFSYAGCLLLGIPLISFLKSRKLLNVVAVGTGGALLGIAVFYAFGFVLSAVLGSHKGAIPTLGDLLSGGMLGASVAIPFGVIAGFPMVGPGRSGESASKRE